MIEMTDDHGLITMKNAEYIEEFSLELLKRASPFMYKEREFITLIAANGVWVYRIIGWGGLRPTSYRGYSSVKAVKYSYEPYDVPYMGEFPDVR